MVKRVLEVSPDKGVAYDRVGSIYFALGRGDEALGMWQTALAPEKDPERKAGLTGSINVARRTLGLPDLPVSAPPRVRKKPARKPPTKKGPKVPVLTDKEEAQAAYQEGVEKYASGEYLAATTLFMKALDIDPTRRPQGPRTPKIAGAMSLRAKLALTLAAMAVAGSPRRRHDVRPAGLRQRRRAEPRLSTTGFAAPLGVLAQDPLVLLDHHPSAPRPPGGRHCCGPSSGGRRARALGAGGARGASP